MSARSCCSDEQKHPLRAVSKRSAFLLYCARRSMEYCRGWGGQTKCEGIGECNCSAGGGLPPSDGSIGRRWKEDQLIHRSTFDFEWNWERGKDECSPKLSLGSRHGATERVFVRWARLGTTEKADRPLFALSLLARRRQPTRRGGRSPLPPPLPMPFPSQNVMLDLVPPLPFRPGGETGELPAHRRPKMPMYIVQFRMI